MALIGNQSIMNKSSARLFGGTASVGASGGRTSKMSPGILFSRMNSINAKASFPTGYGVVGFTMPRSTGELSSFTRIAGLGSLTGTGLSAVIMSPSAIAGTSSITGTANALGLAVASGASDGVATVTGDMTAAASMSGTIAGVASVTANLGATIPAAGTSAGVASVTANLKGTARLGGEITIGASGYLSNDDVERLAEAVAGTTVETGYDLVQALRLILSATAGKVSGASTTTITFRNVGDSKNRIVATVDEDGNRSAITYNVSE